MFARLEIFILLLSVIAIVGIAFRKSSVPISLLLVITGMCLSYFPLPAIALDQNLILDVFLPLLIYEVSSESSWRDVKKNMRSIVMLSIGHVVFITFLVAVVIHWLIPELGWPLAIVLGAVVSPPDDVAIVSVAEKIRMPSRIVTILKSEGMLNDAAALILFRFGLVAIITHQFSMLDAMADFFVIIIGETLYGIALGFSLGKLRLKVQDPSIQMIISLLTPFLAYLPAERFGGCGVLATAVTGLVIGHYFLSRFPVSVRLNLLYVWPTLCFILQSILFLLVGLDLRNILQHISPIATSSLALYSIAVILTVIGGRFFWVYLSLHLPTSLILARVKKKVPWQYPIVISWAGMRGGISLAAALAVPVLPMTINGANLRDLIIFLVFCVIVSTLLLQGLTLPWLLNVLKIPSYGQKERIREHQVELSARIEIARAVICWLEEYEKMIKDVPPLIEEAKLYLQQYRILKRQLKEDLKKYQDNPESHEVDLKNSSLLERIVEVERNELTRLWHEEKITYEVKKKLLLQLDYRARHLE